MYIGIDLGGTNIAAGLVDVNGNILVEKIIPTKAQRTANEVIDDMIMLVRELVKENDITMDEIDGLGVGCPGYVSNNSVVVYNSNLKWRNVHLGEIMKKELGKDVYVGNDATVAALAEVYKGSMKGADNAVLLTLGTGVGSGIVINKKVYSGTHGIGAELGHIVVGENYYECNCGKNGCLETFVSSTAIIRYTEKLLSQEKEKSLIQEKLSNGMKLNAKLVFDCAKKGDKLAIKSVDRCVRYLAIGIENIINILDPEVIAIGGGVANAGEYLLNRVVEQAKTIRTCADIKSAKIVLAELGNKAGIVGAAMLCK